jgi:hypothetical protein
MKLKALYPLAGALVLACASGGVPDPTITANTRKSSILSSEEIENAHADVTNAYDAIARLRPNWLLPHGITSSQNMGNGTEYAVVYVDGQSYGDLNALRGIPAYHVGSIRYWDVTQAGARFGIRAGSSGVIEVSMKTALRQ